MIFLKLHIFLENIAVYVLLVVCRPTLYRPHIKVYVPPPVSKKVWQENQVHENAADQHFR